MKETPELFWPMAYWSWLATGSIIFQLASSSDSTKRRYLIYRLTTRQRKFAWWICDAEQYSVNYLWKADLWQLLPSLWLFCYVLGISELKMPYIYKFTYKKYRLTFQWSAFPADMWSLSSLCKKNHKATTSPLSRKTKWNTLNIFFFSTLNRGLIMEN